MNSLNSAVIGTLRFRRQLKKRVKVCKTEEQTKENRRHNSHNNHENLNKCRANMERLRNGRYCGNEKIREKWKKCAKRVMLDIASKYVHRRLIEYERGAAQREKEMRALEGTVATATLGNVQRSEVNLALKERMEAYSAYQAFAGLSISAKYKADIEKKVIRAFMSSTYPKKSNVFESIERKAMLEMFANPASIGCTVEHYVRGQCVFEMGDRVEPHSAFLYVVMNGSVGLWVSAESANATVDSQCNAKAKRFIAVKDLKRKGMQFLKVLKTGESFGELALFPNVQSQPQRTATIVAQQSSILLLIPSKVYVTHLHSYVLKARQKACLLFQRLMTRDVTSNQGCYERWITLHSIGQRVTYQRNERIPCFDSDSDDRDMSDLNICVIESGTVAMCVRGKPLLALNVGSVIDPLTVVMAGLRKKRSKLHRVFNARERHLFESCLLVAKSQVTVRKYNFAHFMEKGSFLFWPLYSVSIREIRFVLTAATKRQRQSQVPPIPMGVNEVQSDRQRIAALESERSSHYRDSSRVSDGSCSSRTEGTLRPNVNRMQSKKKKVTVVTTPLPSPIFYVN